MHRVDSVIRDSFIQPRPYQRKIVGKASQMFRGEWENGGGVIEPAVTSVMIESPTGSGKTIMALLAARTLQFDNPDLVVGWVAMRRNLLGQAAKENRDKGINVQNIHFVSMFDKAPNDLLLARREGKRILMVVDEAQHDAASSMSHLHNMVEPEWILGMTATPFRTDRMKLCFQKVVKDAGIHQLIQDGFLSPYHHYTIPDWDPKTVAEHYLADPERWGKSAFYFVNLEQCEQFFGIMRENRVHAEFVTGSSNREIQMERFENRRGVEFKSVHDEQVRTGCDVLVNCMVLTEGWDFPGLQTAWVRDSRKGPTMQMGGRAFRKPVKPPFLPFKQIVQSEQTKWPFMRTAMPAMSYVWAGDEFRSLQVNPRLNDINQAARMAIATTDVEIPKFIGERRGRGRARVWRG